MLLMISCKIKSMVEKKQVKFLGGGWQVFQWLLATNLGFENF